MSPPDDEFRAGNLLADIVKRQDLASMPPAFLAGVRQHRQIDAFTDTHPIIHRSRARISAGFRRTAGILVDVFYDHFLAIRWPDYAPEPLDAFLAAVYQTLRDLPFDLPPYARVLADQLVAEDWLGSYRQIDGIEMTLRRLSFRLRSRTGRDFSLDRGIAELTESFEDLEADFVEYFPLLQTHVGS